MSHARFKIDRRDSNVDGIPRELAELGQLITSGSSSMQPELKLAFQRVVDSIHRRSQILELVQEALAQLRLDIKYLMFDLEATRQERDELRQKFEDWSDGR